MTWRLSLVCAAALACAGLRPVAAQRPQPAARSGQILDLQVLLDRAGFSPGEIDGRPGANTDRALRAFAAARRLADAAIDNPATLQALGAGTVDTLTSYSVTAADVAGPFLDVLPDDMMQMASLPGLFYTSAAEALGERVHASPTLLHQLNPQARFQEGDVLRVPNVEMPVDAAGGPRAARVVVSKHESLLRVFDAADTVIFAAPVTSGSVHDPLPIGHWTVTAIVRSPTFHYNPALFWDADPGHAKATIPPGPNNPVGVVWIDIDKEHYGLHGTAEPGHVGHTASHGCVRLTNWDALIVAQLVQRGTPVLFEE